MKNENFTVFRYRKGEIEIDLRGERDFVEQQLADLLPRILAGEDLQNIKELENLKRNEKISDDEEKEAIEKAETGEFEPPVMRVRRRIELDEFRALKSPSNSVEHLLTLAYYLEKYEGFPEYEVEDLKKRWPDKSVEASWDEELLERCLSSGFLENRPSGAFTLTFTGEQYVQGGF